MSVQSSKRMRSSRIIQSRAIELRRDMTLAERRLWRALRGNALEAAHFRRQHAAGSFILDFYCARAKLAIEVDGGQHREQAGYDAERAEWLWERRGIRVIRFTNEEALRQLDAVVIAILEALGDGE
jgi:very-short-patch-repair endonuclease